MAGKVETMACLMLVMRIDDDSTDKVKNKRQFFQMYQQVLQTKVDYRNYLNCSTRWFTFFSLICSFNSIH